MLPKDSPEGIPFKDIPVKKFLTPRQQFILHSYAQNLQQSTVATTLLDVTAEK
jgi:hypothetical protein